MSGAISAGLVRAANQYLDKGQKLVRSVEDLRALESKEINSSYIKGPFKSVFAELKQGAAMQGLQLLQPFDNARTDLQAKLGETKGLQVLEALPEIIGKALNYRAYNKSSANITNFMKVSEKWGEDLFVNLASLRESLGERLNKISSIKDIRTIANNEAWRKVKKAVVSFVKNPIERAKTQWQFNKKAFDDLLKFYDKPGDTSKEFVDKHNLVSSASVFALGVKEFLESFVKYSASHAESIQTVLGARKVKERQVKRLSTLLNQRRKLSAEKFFDKFQSFTKNKKELSEAIEAIIADSFLTKNKSKEELEELYGLNLALKSFDFTTALSNVILDAKAPGNGSPKAMLRGLTSGKARRLINEFWQNASGLQDIFAAVDLKIKLGLDQSDFGKLFKEESSEIIGEINKLNNTDLKRTDALKEIKKRRIN